MNKRRKPLQTRSRAAASSSLKKKGLSADGIRRLHNYTTVTKPAATTAPEADALPVKVNACVFDCIAPVKPPLDSAIRKRKLVTIDQDSSPISCTNHDLKIKRRPHCHADPTPQTPCRPIPLTQRRSTTSTERARGLLDKFFISNPPPSLPPSRAPSDIDFLSSSNSQSLSRNHRLFQAGFPSEFIDLVNLSSVFLKVFSIHCAHNGTHCPADQKVVCQNVALAWRKRNVSLIDLRRVLGTLNARIDAELESEKRLSRIVLSDHGNEKVCFEVSEMKGNTTRLTRPVNVEILNNLFIRGLHDEWSKWNGVDTQDFIDSLPLEPITRCTSYLKISPLLAKGQRRLESIRGVSYTKIPLKNNDTESDKKKTTLLERLRAKQLHQSTLPQPPSKADIIRERSFTRLEEVSAVLTMLISSSSIGQKRVSFTLPTVLEKLKDSLKICNAEGEMCVKIIASEIAPEWIRFVNLKKKQALVVNKDARPGDLEFKERIKQFRKN